MIYYDSRPMIRQSVAEITVIYDINLGKLAQEYCH